MKDLFDIKDRVIVITGGTGVLVSVISAYLANQGAKIVILGRNEDKGKEVVEKLVEDGNEAIFLKTDVLDSSVLEKIWENRCTTKCCWR